MKTISEDKVKPQDPRRAEDPASPHPRSEPPKAGEVTEQELEAKAPTPGTAAGPGSTESIGQAAGNTLGAPASGAGNAPRAGRTDNTGGTNAPARNLEDAAGGPSSPAGTTTRNPGGTDSKR